MLSLSVNDYRHAHKTDPHLTNAHVTDNHVIDQWEGWKNFENYPRRENLRDSKIQDLA